MSVIINKDGISIDSFDEIRQRIIESFKRIYGEDINTDQDTADGQAISIFAKEIHDCQVLLAYLYNNLDPDVADGGMLRKLARMNNLVIEDESKSQMDLRLVMSARGVLSADFSLADSDGNVWVMSGSVTLIVGVNYVTFTCQELGDNKITIDDIEEQVSLINNVTDYSIENLSVGGKVTSDYEVRQKRLKTFESGGAYTIGSMLSKIITLRGVSDCVIRENSTNEFDDNLNLDGHSIWIVVDGGDAEEIAETIAYNKTSGCGLKGDIEKIVTENIDLTDLYSTEVQHIVFFDRPARVELKIQARVKRKISSEAINIDLIKKTIADTTFRIGEDCEPTAIYGKVHSLNGNFIIYGLKASKDGEEYSEELIKATAKERFVILVENIKIVEDL